MILLETERLRVRRFEPADLDRLVEFDSDSEVMKYITYGQPTPRERYEREILPRWILFHGTMPLLGCRAAGSRMGGGVVGWFRLRPDRFDAGEQEPGYRLRQDAWGHGLATEGGRALLARGFELAAVKYSITRPRWLARRV